MFVFRLLGSTHLFKFVIMTFAESITESGFVPVIVRVGYEGSVLDCIENVVNLSNK